tara:strand:- start:284 stop:1570 length:1287 start_codon:yes stop_codon:yes gene_type:complete
MKKIAIVGSGISGTSAAYYLNKMGYDVSLFEKESYFGGHTNTIDIKVDNKKIPIDTGFLVHNDTTYPNLVDFFEELKIDTHSSEMSFSVVRNIDKILWAGTNLLTVFAQIKNIFSLRYYRFLIEVLRFNSESKNYIFEYKNNFEISLEELLKKNNYSEDFKNWYLLPMGASIWSSPTNEILKYPASTFLNFCSNHGLLQIFGRPNWKTIKNGCKKYVDKALISIENKYLKEPVLKASSIRNKIKLVTEKRTEYFDFCLFCCHPPQTLKILENLNFKSSNLLSKFKFQKNIAVLHFDQSVLPDKKIAWSAWNYLSTKSSSGKDAVSVSYLINKLQPIPLRKPVIVTLNPVTKIDSRKIYKVIDYEHPLFDKETILAQNEMKNVQGKQGVYFGGAWLRYGFHEDGIISTKKIINQLLEFDGKSMNLISIL